MTARFSRGDLIALAVLVAALLVIYLPGLGNAPVFDDAYLVDGELFRDFAGLSTLRARFLSYGSFVWVQALFGDGWWKQRIVNLAIHFAVVLSLWGLYREWLRHVELPASHDPSPALAFAIGFFALNPVAVYAVAYLIQRSILLATLFVVLALWLFSRGLSERKPWMHALALLCYVLAVLSKEHAVLAPLAALPVYILVVRPGPRRLALVATAGAAVVAVAAYVLSMRYGRVLAAPFDEYSRVYLRQLARLNPGADQQAYPLSVLNQAYLFFEYGTRWLIPYAGWMSINLRPPFPVAWLSFPQALGALGYVGVVVAGFGLLLKYRDWRALLAVSVLVPALLFATEFATVWVQDPFVLYRSYLWAIGVPGLIFLLVQGTPARVLLLVGLGVASLLVWQSLDRILSLSTPERAMTDAIRKLSSDPRAVGRWVPYLVRGNVYLDRDDFDLAARDFESSAALGDMGMGTFNLAAIYSLRGRNDRALAAFDRAEQQGFDLVSLPYQRGRTLLAMGRLEEAYLQFVVALRKAPPSPTLEALLLDIGRVCMRLGRREEAAHVLEDLLKWEPGNREGRELLGLAYVMNGDNEKARALLDKLIAEEPRGRAYYARALANHALKRKAEALADIDAAIRIGPDNPNLREWQAKIRAMK